MLQADAPNAAKNTIIDSEKVAEAAQGNDARKNNRRQQQIPKRVLQLVVKADAHIRVTTKDHIIQLLDLARQRLPDRSVAEILFDWPNLFWKAQLKPESD